MLLDNPDKFAQWIHYAFKSDESGWIEFFMFINQLKLDLPIWDKTQDSSNDYKVQLPKTP